LNDEERTARLRMDMVETQIRRRGIGDARVLDVMREVPRHLFMTGHSIEAAYGDHAMPIGHGQTISQPYMVAIMTQVLIRACTRPGKVLEIGSGSGYQAAILSRLFREVITIERIEPLASETAERLRRLGYANVTVVTGDGTLGREADAPYDGIMVTAGAPHVPSALRQQLADGAALVIPVGSRFLQQLEIITRRGAGFREASADGCVFVPLVGADGWEM
jgi:protein-L-isoaspartate(D-aspartate) O-methyltransferase